MAKYQMLLLAIFIATLVCLEIAAAGATEQLEQTEKQGALVGSKNRSPYLNCAAACDYRCSKAGLHKRCLKYCNICCGKCQCVPPGTAGNREVCPCYNEMKNSRGGHKCP
ncbi:peamaclein [Selaginella moellendorffii]|uniref:peamaclein n=1 Tax=Selaginella moellendorffii TaxID=88036 RepID=UPI000D1C673D|nr:peamaclein [Selaginella moellendorffii]|eukprot:XP_024515710.1 peamaclein [Selaginella moellendorffii]